MTLERATGPFFDAAPDALLVVDAVGRIVAANERAHALFDVDPGALVGVEVDTLLPSDRAAHHATHRAAFFSGDRGSVYRAPQPLGARRRSGEVLEVEVSLSLTRVDGVAYAVAALRELSERERALRQARMKLQGDASLYRAITESIPNALLGVFDRDSQLVVVEGALAGEAPIAREDLLHHRVVELATPERRAFVADACRRCLAGERVEWIGERGGRVIDITLVPLRDEAGEVIGGLGLLYDVTDRERELARLAELSNELEGVLESIPDPIVIRDHDMAVYVNSALARKLGYDSPQALVDRRILERVHPDDRELALRRMAAVEAGAPVGTIEIRYLDRDGEPVPLESDPPRRVIYRGRPGWLLVLYDRREQKRGMLALASHERMVTVGTLAAGVGHEINNPLTYVIGNLDLLLEEVQTVAPLIPQPRGAEMLDLLLEARDGAERIRKIVRGLRTFARGEREERAHIDLHAVVEMALQLAQSALRHVTPVSCELLPTPLVLAEESQLVQVMVNLLVNAAHALSRTPMERNLVQIRLWASGERVVLEVTDNGPGMTHEVAQRVFEPFFTTKGVRDGTGLGLSIVHNIVTGLGGSVECVTSPGQGATFRVTLPAAST